MSPQRLRAVVILLASAALCGCVQVQPYDYTALRARRPVSILVLPPLNQTVDVNGPYSFLSTVTLPLAEQGYYVYPVQVIDEYLKENGLPTAGEMNQVAPAKLHEIVGADAVLYLDLLQYGTKYAVLASTTVVSARAKLVDTQTGQTLWEGTATVQQNPNNNSGGLLGALVGAALNQIINSKTDLSHQVAAMTSNQLFTQPGRGLLFGPHHPKHGSD